MHYLIISLLALIAAPLLYLVVQKLGDRVVYLEKTVFFVVAALVVLQILPESYEAAGWPILIVALLGWVIPTLLERFWHKFTHGIHNVPIFFAVVGLGLHETFDGVALSVGNQGIHGVDGHAAWHSLPLAIVIHRYPTALFLWWLLKPRYGVLKTVIIFSILGTCTILGYIQGTYLVEMLEHGSALAYFQAFVGGSLLHLASHQMH